MGSVGAAALRESTLDFTREGNQFMRTSLVFSSTCVLMQPWMYFPAEFTVVLYKIRCDRLGNNISDDFFFFLPSFSCQVPVLLLKWETGGNSLI